MSLPSQRRKSSPIREGGLRSWRSGARRFVRPQLEQLEDRVLLNYDFGSTPFQWVELNGDPTATNHIGFVDQGNWANPIDLGSNTINFYGNIFGGATGIWASSNGLITFGNGNSDFRNGDLMTDPGQAAMAPLWSSYFKYNEPSGPMVLSKIDTLNNRLIIEWNQVHDYVTYNNGSLTFEAIIQLNTGATPGNIVFNYLQLDYFLGSSASVGIKDGDTQGPNAVVISVNALNPLVDNNHAILFAWPSAPKIPVISDLSGNTASEGSPDINVTVNGANFASTSLVQVNDTELATSFINDTQLQATIPASLLAEEGNLTVTVSTPGSSGGTSNAVSFIVMDAPLTAAGASISATEGASFSGPIANFSDSNPGGTLSDYAATIDWGDGQTSTGTITVGPNGTFVVSGDHAYVDEGNFSPSVQIADVGGAAITTIGSAAVGDAALDAQGTTINATEAAAFSGVVATFADANPYGTAGDFSAMIAWGDGLSTPGTVSANGGGSFSVSGAHTYSEEGSSAITITLTDVGGAGAVANSTALVGDAPLTAIGSPVSSVEGGAFSGVVATFTDANANAPEADFTALITWGDGNTSPGIITSTASGGFAVSGTNSYAEEGTYVVSVQITDVGSASAIATTTAAVVDAALQAVGTTISTTEGSVFVGTVASFTDSNAGSAVSDFTAIVSWGDGSSSTGAIVSLGSGQYAVHASHTFEEGNYAISVQITDVGGSATIASSNAVVADAAVFATAVPISSVEGSSFSAVVAVLADANPVAGPDDFSATISWGDGTSSPGTITANPSGGFDVSGSHSYLIKGTLAFSVTITDKGGSAATTNGSANVADAQLAASGVSLTETQGVTFRAVVASFTDGNLLSTAGDFIAAIFWGDGTASFGTIIQNGAGNYSVLGRHTYMREGIYTVTILIVDFGLSYALAQSTVRVLGSGGHVQDGSVSIWDLLQ